jgi:hypothetical protein
MKTQLITVPIYGDQSWRGKCATETAEQVTFFNRLRRTYPDTLGRLAIHPRNEGKRTHQQTMRQKAEGMTAGTSDIVIPGSPAFVCELKRRDHTQSKIELDQIEYLEAAQSAGCFACVALGCNAAWEAMEAWLESTKQS